MGGPFTFLVGSSFNVVQEVLVACKMHWFVCLHLIESSQAKSVSASLVKCTNLCFEANNGNNLVKVLCVKLMNTERGYLGALSPMKLCWLYTKVSGPFL